MIEFISQRWAPRLLSVLRIVTAFLFMTHGAQKLLGFPAQDCVVFEDTAAGIQSGKAAGMKVVGLTTTYPASALKAADAIVKNLRGVQAEVANGRVKLTLPA